MVFISSVLLGHLNGKVLQMLKNKNKQTVLFFIVSVDICVHNSRLEMHLKEVSGGCRAAVRLSPLSQEKMSVGLCVS